MAAASPSLCLSQEAPFGAPNPARVGDRGSGCSPTRTEAWGGCVGWVQARRGLHEFLRWRACGAPSADGGRVRLRAAPGLPSLFSWLATRDSWSVPSFRNTLSLPGVLLGRRGGRSLEQPTEKRRGASAARHSGTRADEEVTPQEMPCGLRSTTHAAPAALHRLSPSFLLTTWRPLRLPLFRRPGLGNRRQRNSREGQGMGPHQDVLGACLPGLSQGLH